MTTQGGFQEISSAGYTKAIRKIFLYVNPALVLSLEILCGNIPELMDLIKGVLTAAISKNPLQREAGSL